VREIEIREKKILKNEKDSAKSICSSTSPNTNRKNMMEKSYKIEKIIEKNLSTHPRS